MLSWLKRLAAPVAAVALFVALPPAGANADPLLFPIGATGVPSFSSLPAGTLADSISGNFAMVDGLGNTTGTGSYNVFVYSPDTGTGFTTIAFNFSVATGAVERVTLRNFGSFAVDVTQTNSGLGTATGVTRLVGDIGFNFGVPIGYLDPDGPGGLPPIALPFQSTNTFILRTDAPTYTAGSIVFQDGGNAREISFAPAAVPLPATAWMGLVLIGGVGSARGMSMVRRRRALLAA